MGTIIVLHFQVIIQLTKPLVSLVGPSEWAKPKIFFQYHLFNDATYTDNNKLFEEEAEPDMTIL